MTPARVLYSSPFVPAEWLAAHGLQPYRVYPASAAESGLNAGLCGYAQAFCEKAARAEASAVIVAATCDQMRRSGDLLREKLAAHKLFQFNVPATWQTVAAKKMYRDELLRLGRFLSGLSGKAPGADELAALILDYDERRFRLLSQRETMNAREHAEAWAAFHQGALPRRPLPRATLGETPAAQVALLGGPLARDQFSLYTLIENSGLRIALDGTESGERTLPARCDREALKRDPLDELCRMYFEHIPDTFRRPNAQLYEWLKTALRAHGIRGILLVRQAWCDFWHAEVHRLKNTFDIPVIELDCGSISGNEARVKTRVRALWEALG